jgi:transposase-like protein
MEEVKAWQARPLEELYPIVYLDALLVRVGSLRLGLSMIQGV